MIVQHVLGFIIYLRKYRLISVKYRGQEGTVVDINGSLIMVSLDDGRHVDSYTASQLEKAW